MFKSNFTKKVVVKEKAAQEDSDDDLDDLFGDDDEGEDIADTIAEKSLQIKNCKHV